MQIVTKTDDLEILCARLSEYSYVTIDTEFLRESTFWPELCLVQIASDDESAIIDPLAEGISLEPLFKLLQNPNVLVMDEPTNHLDMESIEALNLALDNYEGTLIFVSHDREFVSSLSTKVVELKEDGMHYYSGNYEDYLKSQR